MRRVVSPSLVVGALVFTAGAAGPSPAQASCDQLVGKQITLRGRIISAEPFLLGGSGVDAVVIQSSEPACGKIQTSLKLRSCRPGHPFSGSGLLLSEISTRSGGSTRPDAADYAFRPDDNACR